MHLQAATEDHIRCLLTMSEDSDQNTNEAVVDQLLVKWRQKDESEELKGLLKFCCAPSRCIFYYFLLYLFFLLIRCLFRQW